MEEPAHRPAPKIPPTQQALTMEALQLWTEQNKPQPQRSADRYVTDQRKYAGMYEAAVVDQLSPGAASPPPQPTRLKRRLSSDDRAETALVLHSDDDENAGRANKKSARPSKQAAEGGSSGKRKQSLVSALKPRQGSHGDGTPLLTSSKPRVKVTRRAPAFGDEESGSSPLLVPRVEAAREERGLGVKRKASTSSRKENEDVPRSAKDRKGRGQAAPELELELPVKGRSRTINEVGEDEQEVAERLRQRRQRRRDKAVIVKDRSQSAAASGAAVASKIKSRRASEPVALGSEDDSDAEVEPVPEKKKKRKRSTEEVNQELQEVQKAKNVGASRLTLKPPTKLGIFHNAAASVRTKVGKQLPDLAFSEYNFLHATRPSPPASSSSTSASEIAPKRSAHQTIKTYGSKGKKRRSTFPVLDASDDSGSPEPTRPKTRGSEQVLAASTKANKRSKSQRQAESAPRAPTPKKSKGKKAAPPPRSSSPVAADSSEAHSAYSLEQRRTRSASKGKEFALEQVEVLKETLLDTSAFWSRKEKEPQVVAAAPATKSSSVASRPVDFLQPSSSSGLIARPSSAAHSLPYNPDFVLSSPRSLTSGSLDRLIRECDFPLECDRGPHPLAQHSIVGNINSPPSSLRHFNAAEQLGISTNGGSSTAQVRREVAQGVRMGPDGTFRMAGSSEAAGGSSSLSGPPMGPFVAESEAEWGEPAAPRWEAGGGGGIVARNLPSDAFVASEMPSTEHDHEEDLMPPPPMMRPLDLHLGPFSSHHHAADTLLGLVDGRTGRFGDELGASADSEDASYRKAMTTHWYKSKC